MKPTKKTLKPSIALAFLCCIMWINPMARSWVDNFRQDHLYIKNNYHQPIRKMDIHFFDSTRLVLRNISPGESQSQPFDHNWGAMDEHRMLTIQAVTSGGKRIGSNEILFIGLDNLGGLITGAELDIVVEANGTLKLSF